LLLPPREPPLLLCAALLGGLAGDADRPELLCWRGALAREVWREVFWRDAVLGCWRTALLRCAGADFEDREANWRELF
jgi:hypothetical protein